MKKKLCIVISHYNARPKHELIHLLKQLQSQVDSNEPNLELKLLIVVNDVTGVRLDLPNDFAEVEVMYRENSGFNIGSWECGWRQYQEYDYFIFLQDESKLVNPNAVKAYVALLENNPNTLYGESLFFHRGWKKFLKSWPAEQHFEFSAFANQKGIKLGASASHLQTLILAASCRLLRSVDGFILSSDKIEAVATEVLFSRKVVSKGFSIRQSAWYPFTYFGHEQWDEVRVNSRNKLTWSLSKLYWICLYGWRR
jgi:hypothetical protein